MIKYPKFPKIRIENFAGALVKEPAPNPDFLVQLVPASGKVFKHENDRTGEVIKRYRRIFTSAKY